MTFTITDGRGADLSSVVCVTEDRRADDALYYEIGVSARLSRVRIEWTERMLDHVSVWHPTCGRNRGLPQFFHVQRTDACFFCGAPVLATVRADGSVHRVAALGDPVAASALGYYVDDFNENDRVIFSVELYDVEAGFTTALRVSDKRVPLADALGEVWRW